MKKPGISFFSMDFILLFAVISFILIVFDLHRFSFVFELGIALILIFLLVFAMFAVYHNRRWGWTILGLTLVILLINTLLVSMLAKKFETAHLTTVVFSVAGLAVSLLNLRHAEESAESAAESLYEESSGYASDIDKIEPKKEQLKEERPKVEKRFVPGKFIASKKANKFHSPKCDWAKKISKSNQVWFNSGEEAKAQGFEADKCVS